MLKDIVTKFAKEYRNYQYKKGTGFLRVNDYYSTSAIILNCIDSSKWVKIYVNDENEDIYQYKTNIYLSDLHPRIKKALKLDLEVPKKDMITIKEKIKNKLIDIHGKDLKFEYPLVLNKSMDWCQILNLLDDFLPDREIQIETMKLFWLNVS